MSINMVMKIETFEDVTVSFLSVSAIPMSVIDHFAVFDTAELKFRQAFV